MLPIVQVADNTHDAGELIGSATALKFLDPTPTRAAPDPNASRPFHGPLRSRRLFDGSRNPPEVWEHQLAQRTSTMNPAAQHSQHDLGDVRTRSPAHLVGVVTRASPLTRTIDWVISTSGAPRLNLVPQHGESECESCAATVRLYPAPPARSEPFSDPDCRRTWHGWASSN